MEVKACRRCGKIFQYIAGAPICQKCKKIEEDLFQEVKTYLRENKGANMQEVTEATGASVAMIERYLREGRLEVTADSLISLDCEQCGVKIRTGRLCDKCRANLSSDLNAAAKSIQSRQQARHEKDKEKMRFLGSYKTD